MIVTKGLVEAPVLDALFRLSKRPRPEDALLVLREESVLDAAFVVAERMRSLAKAEDDEREKTNTSLNSYRRFYVGGVGIGVTLTGSSRNPYDWWVFAAINSKPSKQAEKYCAEMRIIRAAREYHCPCIGGLVVLGENQPDKRSGKLRQTLDPCGECRDCMRSSRSKYMFRPNTLIATAKPLSQFRYVETVSKMMAAHGEKW